jgi:integrase
MARKPGVRVVNGHWYSQAGGVGRYFGKVDQVSHAEAMSRLFKALADGDRRFLPTQSEDSRGEREVGIEASGIREGKGTKLPSPSPRVSFPSLPNIPKAKSVPSRSPSPLLSTQEPSPSPTVNALADAFLAWIERHRPAKAHRERSRHLLRFRESQGEALAIAIGESHIEAFGDSLRADGHAPLYIHKHIASVRMMMRWAIRQGLLPKGHDPFANAEPVHVPPKPLLESDLPNQEEVARLIAHAQSDLADLLKVYHATGARTHELIEASVGDFQPTSRTIVLGRHKRSKTLREYRPRTITLTGEALAIVQARCQGREAEAPIFIRHTGKGGWTGEAITQRFQRVRKAAKVRESITIYSLRHLWISEALMLGMDSLLVARMAGTSVAMLEKVYGHFRMTAFAEAQSKLDAMRASM